MYPGLDNKCFSWELAYVCSMAISWEVTCSRLIRVSVVIKSSRHESGKPEDILSFFTV